jgi:hypothetical protein
VICVVDFLVRDDLLTNIVQDQEHFRLEIAWLIDELDALEQMELGLFIRSRTSLLENLVQFLNLCSLFIAEEKL